jgi:hypothetical protein
MQVLLRLRLRLLRPLQRRQLGLVFESGVVGWVVCVGRWSGWFGWLGW